MDHHWRGAIQGNTCPSCSTPHFPFCPNNPNLRFPAVHNPPPPLNHMRTQPPVPPYEMVDPFPWQRNPNSTPIHTQPHPPSAPGNAADYGGMDHRSSKRLKMDSSYAPNSVSCDDERRLKLIHEHGGGGGGGGHYHHPTFGHVEGTPYPRFYANPQNGSHYPPAEEMGVLPPPLDTPGQWMITPPARPSFLFPVDGSSSAPAPSMYPPSHSSVPSYQHISHPVHSSAALFSKDRQGPCTAMYLRGGLGQPVLSNLNVVEKPKIIDAACLFKPPNRDTRPDHFVIILRGLPGSGKSYLARALRELEVENGGKAPRIHSMDDYFMTEVDKFEENETSTSSGRGKKPVAKKVLEYCYEPEMEEAYRSSMLKAFKKTLDEGSFTFIIVDDRNLRVADFAQFWATAKRSGYEVYLLEASYKDPVGCTARNIHGLTRDDVEKMARTWEEAPPLYLQLDAKSLFHGENLKESIIQEVDMDMDDEDLYRGSSESEEKKHENVTAKTSEEIRYDGSKKTWNAKADHPDEEVKDLRCSKWSGDLDEDNVEGSDKRKCKSTAVSGLFRAYGREGKSVHWGDQIPNTGFSIGAVKKANAASLVIGPCSGYNLKSNPLPAEESHSSPQNSGDTKKHSVFQEHLRAEKESFKAVFDRRRQRQRIGGLSLEES